MDDSGVSVLDAFIKDALTAQDQRKASFEQRGLAVITTSGALATLLLALAALSTTKQTTLVLPGSAKPWLIAALILFFVSAVAALGTNVPQSLDPPFGFGVAALVADLAWRGNRWGFERLFVRGVGSGVWRGAAEAVAACCAVGIRAGRGRGLGDVRPRRSGWWVRCAAARSAGAPGL